MTIDELIARETRVLATEILETELAKQNLPLPKPGALDPHIDQLLLLNPKIREVAEERVMAQKDAYSESLRKIGLPVPQLPIGLDL